MSRSLLLLTSFVWTIVILTAVGLFWAYQDMQARWQAVLKGPEAALAQGAPTATPTPAAELETAPRPGPTSLSARPLSPTPRLGEPTPIPVIVRPADETANLGLAAASPATPQPAGGLPPFPVSRRRLNGS